MCQPHSTQLQKATLLLLHLIRLKGTFCCIDGWWVYVGGSRNWLLDGSSMACCIQFWKQYWMPFLSIIYFVRQMNTEYIQKWNCQYTDLYILLYSSSSSSSETGSWAIFLKNCPHVTTLNLWDFFIPYYILLIWLMLNEFLVVANEESCNECHLETFSIPIFTKLAACPTICVNWNNV